MPLATRELVEEMVKRIFPQENPSRISALLHMYGTERYERERERVQLAILKLSEGAPDRLLRLIEMAKQDYRDVLAYAEYPNEMGKSATEMGEMPPQDAKRIRDKDRQQYLEWLDGSKQNAESDT